MHFADKKPTGEPAINEFFSLRKTEDPLIIVTLTLTNYRYLDTTQV